MASNPLVVPLSSLKPFFFKGLHSGGALLGPWWSRRPRNPIRALAKRVHQVPLPLVTQELVRQKTPMLPALRRRIIATTGGDQVQVRVVLTVTPVCMDHGDVAPPERLAPDLAIKSVQALHPASHQRAHQHRGVLVKDRAKHRRDR